MLALTAGRRARPAGRVGRVGVPDRDATHSPILLALPGATIYGIAETGQIERVDYDQALPVRLTREFRPRRRSSCATCSPTTSNARAR